MPGGCPQTLLAAQFEFAKSLQPTESAQNFGYIRKAKACVEIPDDE
jgi:hypothetical protein